MTECSKTVGDRLVSAISKLGVDHVFTLPSANIEPLLRCLTAGPLDPIVAANELSAGFMADGYARVRGTPGVAVVGGGIASIYTLPALVNARIEGAPVLLMSGDVPDAFYGDVPFQSARADGTRSEALFREALGGDCCFTLDPAQGDWRAVADRLDSGRPVYASVPYDVQTAPDASDLDDVPTPKPGLSDRDVQAVRRIADRLMAARRPVVVLGSRMARVADRKTLVDLLLSKGARVVTSVGGLGLVRHDADGYLGPFGYSGTDAAQGAIEDPACDLILFLGGKPGQRDGVGWLDRLSASPQWLARIDSAGSAALALPVLEDCLTEDLPGAIDALRAEIAGAGLDAVAESPTGQGASGRPPSGLLEHSIAQAQAHFGPDLIAFVDAGLHRAAAIRAWRSNGRNDCHMSAEQAPMGWAIAASIGASIARRDARVLCITGDGCMHLLGQEIATAARYQTRVLFLVANNGGLGSISRRLQSEDEAKALGDRDRVDWVRFAGSLGVQGAPAHDANSLKAALEQAGDIDGPFLVDLHLPQEPCRGPSDPRTIFLGG